MNMPWQSDGVAVKTYEKCQETPNVSRFVMEAPRAFRKTSP